jgi:hypothetical protein
MIISQKEKEILRELAKKQFELATSPKMVNLKKEWILHNTLKGNRPMITIELWTFAEDIIPPLMKCESDDARAIENIFYHNIVNHTLFHDDTVINDYFSVGYNMWFKPFDIDVKIKHTSQNQNSLGHHFIPVISDLEADFDKIKKSTFGLNKSKTIEQIDNLSSLFGDILPVKLVGRSLGCSLTQDIVHIMSMEDMFVSMYDYPELFKKMINSLADDYINYFNFLKKEKAILSTTQGEHLAQGSFCFTDELPSKNVSSIKDIWGYLDSQETSEISNEMFGEFVFPAIKKIAERFGLLSYGCCEPTDPFWKDYISKLLNLRKLSISPWCNEEFMGEQLKNSKTIFHRKPSPNYLGIGHQLDENALREHIAKTMKAARGCKIEFSQRDVYQVSKSSEKVRRYIQIIREVCEKYQA